MLDKNNKIYIIDFAVSNDNISLLIREYNKDAPLTEYELSTFSIFYKLANAMCILQTEYIIKTDGDSKENQYWLNESIKGYYCSGNISNIINKID